MSNLTPPLGGCIVSPVRTLHSYPATFLSRGGNGAPPFTLEGVVCSPTPRSFDPSIEIREVMQGNGQRGVGRGARGVRAEGYGQRPHTHAACQWLCRQIKSVEHPGYREMAPPPGLALTLKSYQLQTLAWMVDMEQVRDTRSRQQPYPSARARALRSSARLGI